MNYVVVRNVEWTTMVRILVVESTDILWIAPDCPRTASAYMCHWTDNHAHAHGLLSIAFSSSARPRHQRRYLLQLPTYPTKLASFTNINLEPEKVRSFRAGSCHWICVLFVIGTPHLQVRTPFDHSISETPMSTFNWLARAPRGWSCTPQVPVCPRAVYLRSQLVI